MNMDSRTRIAILALALALSPSALAVNGRDFSATYRYAVSGDVGDQKQVTLSLQVFNHSGTDIANAMVALRGRLPVGEPYGSVGGISIPGGGSVPVSGQFTLPAGEYARWQAGAPPHLWIEFTGADGRQVRRPIELIQRPGRGRP